MQAHNLNLTRAQNLQPSGIQNGNAPDTPRDNNSPAPMGGYFDASCNESDSESMVDDDTIENLASRYKAGDGELLEQLRAHAYSRHGNTASVDALIEKLYHHEVGPTRMDQCRGLIQRYLTEYENDKSINMNSRIYHLHAIIDTESIQYNLYANGQRAMSSDTCEKLSANNLSYIVRRQLVLLTDKQRITSEPAFTTDEVEKIVNFVCDPEKNIEMPKAFTRLSKYEKWNSGFDGEASRQLVALIKRFPGFESTGKFFSQYPSSARVATATESTMATTNTLTTTTTMTVTNATASDNSVNKDDTQTIHAQ